MSVYLQPRVTRIFLGILVYFSCCLPVVYAEKVQGAKTIDEIEQVMLFAIKQEAHAGAVSEREDVCVGFGSTLMRSEKQIVSELRQQGFKFHKNDWCNSGPRGLRISIVSPVLESAPGIYEMTVQLDDLNPIREQGEHFATLLRKGKYTIRKSNGAIELISYRQSCCTNRN